MFSKIVRERRRKRETDRQRQRQTESERERKRKREREREREREVHTHKKKGEFYLDDRECSAKPWPARDSAYVDKSVFGDRKKERERE